MACGADAEEAVGRELEKLPPGWFVRHDIFIGKRWNVDHVIVGPPGVFLFDTKFRSGVVKTTRDGIRVNGRRTDMAEKVQDQAREASAHFREAGLRTWVQPVLVFDNDIRGTRQPDGVHVVGLANAVDYLKQLPVELDDAEVQRLGRLLLDDSTWPHTPPSEDDAVFYETPKQRLRGAAVLAVGAVLGVLAVAAVRGPTAPPPPPPESIEAIGARYRAVGATQYKLRKVRKEVSGVAAESSSLVGYFDGTTLKKAEWTIAGELNEMMFHNGRLEFAFKKDGDSEKRFYLADGKLIAASQGKDRKLVETSGAEAEVFELERRVLSALNTEGDRLRYEGGKFVARAE